MKTSFHSLDKIDHPKDFGCDRENVLGVHCELESAKKTG